MRDLSSYSVVSSSFGDELSTSPTPVTRLQTKGLVLSVKCTDETPVTTKRTFSQKTRTKTMLSNARDAMGFVDSQQTAIKDLIKQLQIFNGYCEQLSCEEFASCPSHVWSVYLMYAQAMQSEINRCFMGKRLFGEGAQPPVRLHLESDGQVLPFDLPDPCLLAMPSIQSFLAGIAQHRLPSLLLINGCIAELLNALIEVQEKKAKLSRIITELTQNKIGSPCQIPGLTRRSTPSNTGWLARFIKVFSSKLFVPREWPSWA